MQITAACDNGNQTPENMEFIISSTIAPDRICPPQSFEVARALNAQEAFCFDVNAVCSGFIYGLVMAESLLKTRNIKLSYSPMPNTKFVLQYRDYHDCSSAVVFGAWPYK